MAVYIYIVYMLYNRVILRSFDAERGGGHEGFFPFVSILPDTQAVQQRVQCTP